MLILPYRSPFCACKFSLQFHSRQHTNCYLTPIAIATRVAFRGHLFPTPPPSFVPSLGTLALLPTCGLIPSPGAHHQLPLHWPATIVTIGSRHAGTVLPSLYLGFSHGTIACPPVSLFLHKGAREVAKNLLRIVVMVTIAFPSFLRTGFARVLLVAELVSFLCSNTCGGVDFIARMVVV